MEYLMAIEVIPEAEAIRMPMMTMATIIVDKKAEPYGLR